MPVYCSDRELHELFNGRLKIFQQARGYRFSLDTILLGCFASTRASGLAADLGTGSGVLSVMLAQCRSTGPIIAIEIQPQLAELARQNVILNGCGETVAIVCADVRKLHNNFRAGQCDTVIANPPFYPVGSGKVNLHSQKAAARHELHGTLHDFMAAAAHLLKHGGRFIGVFTAARIADLIWEMRAQQLEPKTLQFVHARTDAAAAMVLTEGVKGAGTEARLLPPLIVFDHKGAYTRKVTAMFAEIGKPR